MIVHPAFDAALPGSSRLQLRPGVPAALWETLLVLLPSGPDTVQMLADARNPAIIVARCCVAERNTPRGQAPRPRYGGFRVQGTAGSPSSTVATLLYAKMNSPCAV